MKRATRVAPVVCLLFLFAVRVHADPVEVKPGSGFVVSDFIEYWTGTFDNRGTFVLPDLVVGVSAREVFANARIGCSPCTAGTSVNLSSSHELRGFGYFSGGGAEAIWGSGTLNFTAGDVLIPDSAAPSVGLDLIVPFTLDGFITLYGEHTGAVKFNGAVTGRGYTRAFFWGNETERRFHQQIYEFGDRAFQPAPVPEPATVLLCGAGLVALWRSRARGGCGRRP